MKNFDQIEKYLREEINNDEKKAFEEKIANDPGLKKDVELIRDVTEYIEDSDIREFKEKINNIISVERQKHTTKKLRVFNIRNLIQAASILLITGLSVYFIYSTNQNKYERLFNKYYSVYEYSDISRSGLMSDENVENIKKALKKYNEGKYIEASQLYENIIQTDSENIIANFLLSICFIEMGENRKAITELAKLAQNEEILLNETAKWYLGLCYIKTEDNENALKVFRDLENYSNYYQEKAGQILKKID